MYEFTSRCTQAHQPVTSFKCSAGALSQLYPRAGQLQMRQNLGSPWKQAALPRAPGWAQLHTAMPEVFPEHLHTSFVLQKHTRQATNKQRQELFKHQG